MFSALIIAKAFSAMVAICDSGGLGNCCDTVLPKHNVGSPTWQPPPKRNICLKLYVCDSKSTRRKMSSQLHQKHHGNKPNRPQTAVNG